MHSLAGFDDACLPVFIRSPLRRTPPLPPSARVAPSMREPFPKGRAGLPPTTSPARRWRVQSGACATSKRKHCLPVFRCTIVATTGSPGSDSMPMVFSMPRVRDCASWRRPGRAPRRDVDFEHRRDRRCLCERLMTNACPPPLRRSEVHTPHSLGLVSRARTRYARTLPDHGDGLLVQRQDFRQGRAPDSPRHCRCGDSGGRRYAVWQRAVRFQFAGTGRAANRADRSTLRRNGISIGEAAGFALVEREGRRQRAAPDRLGRIE